MDRPLDGHFVHHIVAFMAQIEARAEYSAPFAKLLRYEPTGLSLVSPYTRDKIPVVFIHGLWSNPASWHRMIATLEEDPAIAAKYQFWTFGYSTGDPIPYSAYLLRRNLDECAARLTRIGPIRPSIAW